MKRSANRWMAGLGVLAGAAIAFYVWQQSSQLPVSPGQPAASVSAPSAPSPAIRYPLPAGAATTPLPAVDDSDAAVQKALNSLAGNKLVRKILNPEKIVRHVVATIDALPGKTVATRVLPVRPAPGAFQVHRNNETIVMDPANASRYTSYITLLEQIDPKQLVDTYVTLYPLFQTAYEELGYPKSYFNDRLISVIDHLLSAPEVEGRLALTQPHVVYRFSDPDLEAESAGHKLMLRIGPHNAERVKSRLAQLRRELVSRSSVHQ